MARTEPDGSQGAMTNGPEDDIPGWHEIDWRAVEDEVRRLRQRIFTARQATSSGSVTCRN